MLLADRLGDRIAAHFVALHFDRCVGALPSPPKSDLHVVNGKAPARNLILEPPDGVPSKWTWGRGWALARPIFPLRGSG